MLDGLEETVLFFLYKEAMNVSECMKCQDLKETFSYIVRGKIL